MLLRKDGSVTIHHKNLQLLVTEIYKVIRGIEYNHELNLSSQGKQN